MTDALPDRLLNAPQIETIEHHAPGVLVTQALPVGRFSVQWDAASPAVLSAEWSTLAGRTGVSLVEVFTASEQRARTSQAYWRSAVGSRLRVRSAEVIEDQTSERVELIQHDETTGIRVATTVTAPHGTNVVRVQSQIRNDGDATVILTAVSSATIGFARSEAELDDLLLATADSEWLAENRWRECALREVLPELSLELHGQNGRGHYGLTSHGAWTTGEHLPDGALVSARSGEALAWQIEPSGGWHIDLCQAVDGGVLSLMGATDTEHHFAFELLPGDAFAAVPVAIAVSAEGRDGAFVELTRYRRWLRRGMRAQGLPIVYNDFMNTLMGQPSTESLTPLIRSAAEAGAEVFCIDAGWFADPAVGDWWSTVGEWREAEARFDEGGLQALIDDIQDRGMAAGLWLEPEVVGVESPAARSLPDEAFFRRHGQRVREHDRYHLDFRHPAARAHLDATVDLLVDTYEITYLKLDYNINPGAGTEWQATSAGAGLVGHARAFRDWLIEVQERHPSLLVENCSSGAMRADYALLDVTHLQSTSDQQDFRLYPPIAASAPASILPEQCGNWAYPAVDMSDEETVFTLVTGLSGRLYLSGFLDALRAEQQELVAEAVEIHKRLRQDLASAEPFWPLGLPGWDDDVVCLGLRTADRDLVFVWDRAEQAREVTVPGISGSVQQVFPAVPHGWETSVGADGLRISTRGGLAARVYEVIR